MKRPIQAPTAPPCARPGARLAALVLALLAGCGKGPSNPETSAGSDCTPTPEVCNSVDDDCDGLVDDADPDVDRSQLTTFYLDSDGDGYGATASATPRCGGELGEVVEGGDCDDASAAVSPMAAEVCDGLDDDCDGRADDADPDVDPSGFSSFYGDGDGDGYGAGPSTRSGCSPAPDESALSSDCDDRDPATSPAGQEVCGGHDEDCDGLVDDEDPSVDPAGFSTWYPDADLDGYGDAAAVPDVRCAPLDPGDVPVGGDCDDLDPTRSPGATEVCGTGDEDCDGLVDDTDPSIDPASELALWADADGDGDGDPAVPLFACSFLAGTVDEALDCDDTDPALNSRTAWGIDADADGWLADGSAVIGCVGPGGGALVGLDGDCDDANASVHPAVPDVCADGVDADCSGSDDCHTPLSGLDFVEDGDLDLQGTTAGRHLGSDVAFVPDQSGDGLDDLAIGALGTASAGEVVLVAWPAAGAVDVDASAFASIEGESPDDYAWRLARGGDLDADDTADIVVGAPGSDHGATAGGALYLVRGPILGVRTLIDAEAVVWGDQADLDLGGGAFGAADLTGDGLDDLFYGVPSDDTFGVDAGSARVLPGPLLAPTDPALGYALEGALPATFAGGLVVAVGDTDGDGLEDLAVSDPSADGAGVERGEIHLIRGPILADVALAASDATFEGVSDFDAVAVAEAIGDTDGDGIPELAIGAPHASVTDGEKGEAWIVAGDASGSTTLAGALASIEGSKNYAQFGARIRGTGDLDGDALPDLVVDAPTYDDNGGVPGVVYFASGLTRGSVAADALDPKWSTRDVLDAIGPLDAGRDFDGDGAPDVVIGAPQTTVTPAPGNVYVLFGGEW